MPHDHSSYGGPTLNVDLGAIARNYSLLKEKLAGKACAAVVKADAYGLGVHAVAPALLSAGCRDFFVATLEEAIRLRAVLEKADAPAAPSRQSDIYVFHGVRAGEAKEFARHRLIPILNHSGQIAGWQDSGPCALHVDTGMRRLGITASEAVALAQEKKVPPNLKLILSHLACAGEPGHPLNRRQREEFAGVLPHFPGASASLANSSGIFLGEAYHFALARPGCALYGISPDTALPNPMENVVTLSAPVLQYRTVEAEQSVGYGATATVPEGTVLATVELGYADGFLRHVSGRTQGFAHGIPAPLIGRVSMDMVSLDVTRVPAYLRTADLRITFIGKEQPVDRLARDAGTIGYEIFTRMGPRVRRIYD